MSVTSTSGSGAYQPLALTGLVSGMDSTSVINALMQSYEAPQLDLQRQATTLNLRIAAYQDLNSRLSLLQSAADAINSATGWGAMQATSTNSAVATGTAASGAQAGSVTFTVSQLAQADTLASSGSVTSTSAVIATSPFLVSTGGGALGFASLGAGSGLALGNHTVAVTQSSAAAQVTGATALAGSTTITTGSNDTINVTVNGVAKTYTLAAGTYTSSGLAQAVATASGGDLAATVNSSGQLQLTTTAEGSAATLQITGGTALGTLGLSTMASAAAGTDGVVTVDGTATTVTFAKAGQAVTLAAPAGSITATLSGGLRAGSLTAANVAVGDGSLASVVSAINNAGVGVTATAVQTASSSYILQLASNTTGSAASLSVDPNAFAASPLGTLKTVTAGQDAVLQVGGSGGYSVTSSTNSVSGLLPGLTVNVSQVSSSPVTVTTSADVATLAKQVQSLVDAANSVLSDLNTYTGYNTTTKQAGVLIGDPELQSIRDQVLSIVATTRGTSSLSNAAAAGITLNSDGTLKFDQTAFTSAYNANPSAVQALFSQGGTFSPTAPATAGQVSLVYAADKTLAGSYNVTVSQSAAQATDAGATLASGSITAAETLSVQMGGTTVSYAAQAGASLSSIATGLNNLFAGKGLALSARVVTSGSGSQLVLSSNAYGSAATFQVESSATGAGQTGLATTANTWQSYTGVDVAGTINGVACTGQGQVLSAPTTDPTLAGLALQVTTPGVTTSTSLGTFTYAPGVAAALGQLAYTSGNPATGDVTTTIQGLQGEVTNLNDQAASYQPMIDAERQLLQQQFADLEAQLGNLKNQGSWLASAINQLP